MKGEHRCCSNERMKRRLKGIDLERCESLGCRGSLGIDFYSATLVFLFLYIIGLHRWRVTEWSAARSFRSNLFGADLHFNRIYLQRIYCYCYYLPLSNEPSSRWKLKPVQIADVMTGILFHADRDAGVLASLALISQRLMFSYVLCIICISELFKARGSYLTLIFLFLL